VDDVLARSAWPGERAIGKAIAIDPFVTGRTENRVWATVVGVVRHMRIRSLVEDLTAQVYMPIRMVPRPASYVVKTEGDPGALVGAVREVIRKLEPQTPVYDIRPMRDYLAGARSVQRFTMLLSAAFAVATIALAFVGVYGLVTYSVNNRRYEFGVRLALGADPRRILRLVMGEGLVLLAAGLVMGAVGAVLGAQVLQSQLFGVSPLDAPTYIAAVLIVAAAGLLAAWFPARKACTTDPVEVIRAK
jgi:ABC-type lipoprotein release transport system permease subunit